jgi:putative flavoprotein involved in K+ transport
VRYLESYATQLHLRCGVEVSRIDRVDNGWGLATNRGDIQARHAVVATGPDRIPVRPLWPGLDSFTGTVMHAGEFRNVADAAEKSVLVVGPGNSGVDLLNHLVDSSVGELWLSARSGMTVLPRQLGGVPLHPIPVATRYLPIAVQDANARLIQRLLYGDLTRFGYPRAASGPFSRVLSDGVTAAIDVGFVRALKTGRVMMKPAVDRFERADVFFVDGSSARPDIVITATGYRPGLEALVGHLVELDHMGMPPFTAATSSPGHPGLWFFGLNRSIYGNMHVRRREARRLARKIADDTGAVGAAVEG